MILDSRISLQSYSMVETFWRSVRLSHILLTRIVVGTIAAIVADKRNRWPKKLRLFGVRRTLIINIGRSPLINLVLCGTSVVSDMWSLLPRCCWLLVAVVARCLLFAVSCQLLGGCWSDRDPVSSVHVSVVPFYDVFSHDPTSTYGV